MGCFAKMTAEEAAEWISDGDTVGCSGFTECGCAKAIPLAVAQKAERLHQEGKPFQIRLLTGVSTPEAVDGALSQAKALSYRIPYQSDPTLRALINSGEVDYTDVHLSRYHTWLQQRWLGPIDAAWIEVAHYTEQGELTLTTAVGESPIFCQQAKRIFLEHNSYHAPISGFHDLYEEKSEPPYASIPLYAPCDRIGTTTLRVDPSKIVGLVETNQPDGIKPFKEMTSIHQAMGQQVVDFLLQEWKSGRIPPHFLPIEFGIGNITNAILQQVGLCSEFPPLMVFNEVLQDEILALMEQGRVSFASACGWRITDAWLQKIYQRLDFYRNRLLLRPQTITNSPEVIHRLGLLAFNAALEADLFGNVNSTHVGGTSIMNGIGGGNDYAHNGFCSFFLLPSVAKGGAISTIVPFCSHIDHTEHDVDVVVTEQGLADLRGKTPEQRAACIIEHCAHPDYKPILRSYQKSAKPGHIRHNLTLAFAMQDAYIKTGDMRNARL